MQSSQTIPYGWNQAQEGTAASPWICPACGASNMGKFCESCGSPKPVSSGE